MKIKRHEDSIDLSEEIEGKNFSAHVIATALKGSLEEDPFIFLGSWSIYDSLGDEIVSEEEADSPSYPYEVGGEEIWPEEVGDEETALKVLKLFFEHAYEEAESKLTELDDEEERQSRLWRAVDATARIVSDSLGIEMRKAAGGSYYGEYPITFDEDGDPEEFMKIRVSDHYQKPGGGFSMEQGIRMGEADVEFVVRDPDESLPTEEEILDAVEEAGPESTQ